MTGLRRLVIFVGALAAATASTGASLAAAKGQRIPLPSVRVVVDRCPGTPATSVMFTGACAYPEQALVYLPAGSTRFMRFHEFGHVFDAQYLDDGERNAFKRLIRVPLATPWLAGPGEPSPAEHFADLYAACVLHLNPARKWESAYDLTPSPRRFRQICALVGRTALDRV